MMFCEKINKGEVQFVPSSILVTQDLMIGKTAFKVAFAEMRQTVFYKHIAL